MKLYSLPHSPFSARVRIQIYAKNLPVEIVVPEGFGSPEYKKINLTGKVPALDTGTMLLPESAVIMEYLEERYPETPLLPTDVEQRAQVRLFATLTDSYITKALTPLFMQLFHLSVDQQGLVAMTKNLIKELKLVDQFMLQYGRSKPAALDLADCTLAPVIFFVLFLCEKFAQGDPLAECPHLAAWWQWAQTESSISRAVNEMDEGMQAFLANR